MCVVCCSKTVDGKDYLVADFTQLCNQGRWLDYQGACARVFALCQFCSLCVAVLACRLRDCCDDSVPCGRSAGSAGRPVVARMETGPAGGLSCPHSRCLCFMQSTQALVVSVPLRVSRIRRRCWRSDSCTTPTEETSGACRAVPCACSRCPSRGPDIDVVLLVG